LFFFFFFFFFWQAAAAAVGDTIIRRWLSKERAGSVVYRQHNKEATVAFAAGAAKHQLLFFFFSTFDSSRHCWQKEGGSTVKMFNSDQHVCTLWGLAVLFCICVQPRSALGNICQLTMTLPIHTGKSPTLFFYF
jgi:hypothetical protein